jgi:hypothetical protein
MVDTTANASGLSSFSNILGVGGLVSSALGSYYSSQASKISAQSQADIANLNAQVQERNAQSALLAGQNQVATITQQYGQLKGKQRASMAANGVDLGIGSAAEVQASTDVEKEVAANNAHANAVANAWGYRTQATNFQNQANTAKTTAQNIDPLASAGTTLLSNAGTVASRWYSNKTNAMSNTPSNSGNSSIYTGDYNANSSIG